MIKHRKLGSGGPTASPLHGFGQSSLMVGFYMMPWPSAVAVTALIAGRLANRVSTNRLCVV